MSDDPQSTPPSTLPDPKLLQTLWLGALAIGAIGLLAGLAWLRSSDGPGLDWIWAVAAFGAAALLYHAAFFALCSIFAPALAQLVRDDTEVQGDDVAHVVHYQETGNQALDSYVRAYATARGVSAAAIVSLIIATIAIIFF